MDVLKWPTEVVVRTAVVMAASMNQDTMGLTGNGDYINLSSIKFGIPCENVSKPVAAVEDSRALTPVVVDVARESCRSRCRGIEWRLHI